MFDILRRRKSVFLTLWFSYVIVLLIPVLVAAVLYARMEHSMVDNANRSNLAMLEQVRQVMDNHLQEIDQMTVQIATHPKLQTLWNVKESDQYVQYNDAVLALKNIRSGTGFISEFYIHRRDRDTILSPTLKTDTDTFFTSILPYKDKSLDQVKSELLSGYHFKTFWPATAVKLDSYTNVIACAVSLPLGEKENVWGTLVMLIKEQQFFNLLKQIEWVNSGDMFILDSTGQVVTSTSGVYELPEGVRNQIEKESGYRSYDAGDERVMLSYTTGSSKWKYVSLVPEAVVLKRVNEIKLWAYVMLGVVILAGLIAAYWMANRSYSPIRDMVVALLNGNSPSGTGMNEYEFIKTSIAETIAAGREMKEKLIGHIPVVRAYFLTRLLKGQADPSSVSDQSLEFMGVHFKKDYMCVILIEVDDSSQFRIDDSEKDWALIRFILINLSSEILGDRGYVLETDRSQLALLMNLPDASEAAKAEREQTILEIKRNIEERFKLKISVAVSSIRRGISETVRCYGEALNALDYRIIHGISAILYYEQIREMERTFYHYPMETEAQLMNHVKSGDYESAVIVLDELYQQNVGSHGLTPELGKCLFFDLLSTMLKVTNALKIDEKLLFKDTPDPVKNILNSPSAEVMMVKIKAMCRVICESVRIARTEQNERLLERIMRHIQEHYGDNGLSLTSIADHFNMSPQYISGFFKKQQGKNLTDFVVEIRMQAAKRLLADPTQTVLQVAQRVGYATDIGFIRVFKKMEGVTPGKYRDMLMTAEHVKDS